MDIINIVLADDHGIVRDGIKYTLSTEKNFKVVGEVSNGFEAIDAVTKLHPEVAILDITMPEMNGIDAVREISKKQLNTRCLILSMHDKEEYVMEAIEAGAFGYLLKDSDKEEIVKAVNAVAKGEKYFSSPVSNLIVNGYLHRMQTTKKSNEVEDILTKREKNILRMVVEGHNNKQIAEDLNISIRTIETHRSNIMKKMKVKNAVEMVKKAMEDKLV